MDKFPLPQGFESIECADFGVGETLMIHLKNGLTIQIHALDLGYEGHCGVAIHKTSELENGDFNVLAGIDFGGVEPISAAVYTADGICTGPKK